MGKTRDLLKIRDTKGTFHAKMGTIKDRNGMDLAEAKDIKRGGKNTQKNSTKKIFMTQIIMMVWSLNLSLESKVKWVLGSITMNKASGGEGIPVELFQILKDDLALSCESAALNMPANLENWAVATGLEKVSFHANPKER